MTRARTYEEASVGLAVDLAPDRVEEIAMSGGPQPVLGGSRTAEAFLFLRDRPVEVDVICRWPLTERAEWNIRKERRVEGVRRFWIQSTESTGRAWLETEATDEEARNGLELRLRNWIAILTKNRLGGEEHGLAQVG